MATQIVVPRLGWTMEEGVFVEWLKQDGEYVGAGEPLFTLESEKSTQEVEAAGSGILRVDPAGPHRGDTVPVGAVLGHLVETGEEMPDAGVPPERADGGFSVGQSPTQPKVTVAGPAGRRLARALSVDLRQIRGTGRGGRITEDDIRAAARVPASDTPETTTLAASVPGRSTQSGTTSPARESNRPAISPRAARAAAQLGVDWTCLRGTGRHGRIRERDVLAAAQMEQPAAKTAPTAAASTTIETAPRVLPVGQVRRTIAERLATSVRTTAPVTLTMTADATNLVALRGQFKAAGEVAPSYTDLVVKLVAVALNDHPHLNASWQDDQIVLPATIDIGIAVDTPAGLLVPVIRDVPRLTLRQVATRSHALIEQARAGRLPMEDLQGGTFTVTNLGGLGIEAFTPIINPPQCAVLGLGRIARQPVVRNETIVPRDVMMLSLTFDHRIVDGAPAARFLAAVRHGIERPVPLLVP